MAKGKSCAEPALYDDDQTARGSGVPLPSLRVLQATGAVRSQKIAKHHGGFRRMWPEREALKAALAGAMGEHFAWNIRVASEAMAKPPAITWDALVETAIAEEAGLKKSRKTVIESEDQDWLIELIDRKFLFLKIPPLVTTLLPDAAFGESDLILGMVGKDRFTVVPWAFGTPEGRVKMKKALGVDGYSALHTLYRVGMAAHSNFLSKATINASMQVRAAWRRLKGREALFVQDLIQSRRGDSDQ